MNQRFKGLSIAVGLVMIATPSLRAQTTVSGCGGTSYYSCLAITLTGAGTSTLTFSFKNNSNLSPANNSGSVFELFGLSNTVTPVSMFSSAVGFETACSTAITGCANSSSSFANTFQGTGFTGSFFGLNALPPSPKNGLKAGASASFSLTFLSSTAASSFLSEIDYAAHDLGGDGLPNGCGSNKVDLNAAGQPMTGSANPTNAVKCNGVTSTPEPASFVLVATGMVGVLGAGYRRRTQA